MNLILPPEQLSKALAALQRLSGPAWRLKALQRPSKRRLMQLAAAGGLAAYLCYYYIRTCKRPALYYQQASPFASLVLQRCPLLHQPYRPTVWAINKHLQTVLSALRSLTCDANYHRQLLTCVDGGCIALDWFQGSKAFNLRSDAPILLVLHGLGGGSHEGYCKWLCAAAFKRGWRACVMNNRGCSGLKLTTKLVYSATCSDDLQLAIDKIQETYPDARIYAAGFSLGSMILRRYLASSHADSGLAAAALVSNPFCLTTASARLKRPWTMPWLYGLVLAQRVRAYAIRHRDMLDPSFRMTLVTILQGIGIHKWDETVTCRLLNHADVAEYYQAAGTKQFIPHFRTPSLFLISRDDPLLGDLPINDCSQSPSTIMAVTERGGHVAFLQGLNPFRHAWSDHVCMEYFEAVERSLAFSPLSPVPRRRLQPRRRPLVVCKGPLRALLQQQCKLLFSIYRPPMLAFNPHIMTALGAMRGLTCWPRYHRELLACPDGGTVSLDWWQSTASDPALSLSSPILLVLHGLTGGSKDGASKWICRTAARRGWRAVVLCYRGCAGLEMTSPLTYSAAHTEDIHLAVDHISQQHGAAPVYAAGYSLGSMILAKALTEPGGERIRGAALVSNPCCMHLSTTRLAKTWSSGWVYGRLLAYRMKAYILEHWGALGKHQALKLDRLQKITTSKHVDEWVVCALFGFSTVEDYYTAASTTTYIPSIKTHTLLLVAQDDPFLGRMPLQEVAANPKVCLVAPRCGGHLAFLEGNFFILGEAWMDRAVMAFLETCHGLHHEMQAPAGLQA